MPLPGCVVFFQTKGGAARETLSWEEGHCVGYEEEFQEGSVTTGSYVCHIVIAAPKLTMSPGGPPQPFVAPAPRDYAYVPVPETLAPLVAPAEFSKQQRYDARMNLMDAAQTKLTSGPNDAAQTALTRLQRNNVAVERAKLSEHVYHSDKVPHVLEPEGWHMLDAEELAQVGVSPEMLRDPKSGFKAAVYQSSFERPPKLVISYAGTEDKKDIMADLRQGLGLKEKQYNEAMKLADAVVKSNDKDAVDITGHSLGGGLASAATVVTGTKGYTFNAAGLHANTVRRPPYGVSRPAMLDQGALIDAYRSTSDPLNNIQNGLNFPKGYIAPKALGVTHAVTPAAKWQHKWPELVKSNPLKAAKTMALDGHGIDPQMVDHIEAEKDRDTATLTKYLTP